MSSDSKERFSDRVGDYVKFRPGYPAAVVDALRDKFALPPGASVVDVGAGTGLSCEMFLAQGFSVVAVEPNGPMRAAAEARLARYPGFRAINGSAEALPLPDASADLIFAAQAFHWFDPVPTRREWSRVLKPGGLVMVLFNDRDDQTPVGRAYEALMREVGTDYAQVKHRNVGEERHREFLGAFEKLMFANGQVFDFEGLLGRVRSSSYAPKEGQPAYSALVAGVRSIVGELGQGGKVELDYETHMLVARW